MRALSSCFFANANSLSAQERVGAAALTVVAGVSPWRQGGNSLPAPRHSKAATTFPSWLLTPYGVGRECGVGRALGVTLGIAVAVGVGVTLGVAVAVAVGVTLGVGVVVGVAVGVAVAVAVGVGVPGAHGVTVAVGVGVGGGGVGGGVPTAAAISTRPQP